MKKIITACLYLLVLQNPVLATEKIVLQLRWEHQFQFAGFYAAQWEGYYQEEGLEVEIRTAVNPDGSVMSAIDEVDSGRAQIGVAGPDILIGRDRGVPLVVLGVLAQQSPVIVAVSPGIRIKSPRDFEGLRVRRVPTDPADAEFLAMLKSSGTDISQVRSSTMPYYKSSIYDEMVQGKLDAAVVYSLSGLWAARERGLDISTVRPASYGVDFYGDSIFTTEDYIKENPKYIEGFLRATLRGWRYALDNPLVIADRIASELPRFYPPVGEKRKEFNRFQIQEVTRLSHYPVIQLGHINPNRWQRMHQTLKNSGLISGQLDVDRFIYDPDRRRQEFSVLIYRILIGVLGVVLFLAIVWSYRALLKANRNLTNEISVRRNSEKTIQKLNETLEQRVDERTAELRTTQQELIRKERLATLGQLTATVSHELRNPLGAMRPSLYIIAKKSDPSDERIRNAIERVDRNIDRCDRIIDELLDFSRIIGLDRQQIRINDWLEDVIEEQFISSDIRVEKDLTSKDYELFIDPGRLRRAVINVLENACHAMLEFNAPGQVVPGARLRIESRLSGDRFEILISDTGTGIKQEVLERIFEPLFSTKGFGVGLGMPTVEQIMKQHRGGVEINTQEGKGTRITLWLPTDIASDDGVAA